VVAVDRGPAGAGFRITGAAPSLDQLRIHYYCPENGEVLAALYDNAGRRLYQQALFSKKGANQRILDLAGLPLDPVNPLDGRSLAPLMTQPDPDWPERAIFNVQTNGQLKLFPGAMRTPTYRMVIDRNNQSHLYHMGRDPGQETDLAEEQPELTDSLRQIYEDWFADVTAAGIEPGPIPVGYPQAAVVELPAPEAQLHGNIRFQGGMGWANDYIIHWTAPADSAVWTILPATRGRYGVAVEYTCTEAAVGATLSVSAGDTAARLVLEQAYDPPFLPSPDRVERGEVYEKVWKRAELGSLPFRMRRHRLRLTIDRELPPEALQIKALWLYGPLQAG